MTRKEHLLSILAEECAEVGKLVSKTLRFGIHNQHPVSSLSNKERLVSELNDIFAAVEMLQDEKILPKEIKDEDLILKKKVKVLEYLKKSKDLGLVNKK